MAEKSFPSMAEHLRRIIKEHMPTVEGTSTPRQDALSILGSMETMVASLESRAAPRK